MEQTSTASYPNALVAAYLRKARRANAELLMKTTQYLSVGYQKILTFQTAAGGFGWWAGQDEPVQWVSAYGLQQLVDMSAVIDVDSRVIEKVRGWLLSKQDAEGAWTTAGATHGEAIDSMKGTHVPLTAYVAWTLAETGYRGPELAKAIGYLKKHLKEADKSVYMQALAAMALVSADPKDSAGLKLLETLEATKTGTKEQAHWKLSGQTFSYARGDAGEVEASAVVALAMMKTGRFTQTVNQVLAYLTAARQGSGAWASTQATILALKALVKGLDGRKQSGAVKVAVDVNGTKRTLSIGEDQADVVQLIDFKDVVKTGANEIDIVVEGESPMMYQLAGRYYAPWAAGEKEPAKKTIDVKVEYDRTKLAVNDELKAKVTLGYHGEVTTYMVIVDLGIPPGFQLDPSAFESMVESKQLMKYTVGGRTATLYFGGFAPGQRVSFAYALKAKHPIQAKTPATEAYEYYCPTSRDAAEPVSLEVTSS